MKRILLILFLFTTIVNLSAQSGLPQLYISNKRIDFGKTLFMEKKSQTLTFKNVGDTVLTIYSIDSLRPPFFGTFLFPDTLKQNDSVNYIISYKPTVAARDSQRVFLSADTRLSHSIALLIDISYGMDDPMPNDRSISKIDAAILAAKNFIQSMINTKDVKDEAGIFSFWLSFQVDQSFTTNKQQLINALPTRTKPATALYDAIAKTINYLKDRPYKKVLIALTDGEDNSSYNHTPNSVISLANSNNIIIYTVGIGSSISVTALRDIAERTGGKFYNARTRNELSDIYYKIFNELSKKVTLYFDVVGLTNPPELLLDCPSDTAAHLPEDTIRYKVYLNRVSSESSQGSKYELVFRFNISMLFPLEDNYKYNGDGTVSFFGTVDSNLYSSPLRTIKFLTLVGDEPCADIHLEKIIWDDEYFGEIKSKDFCNICINSCARTLRQIQLVNKNILEQNIPNPFTCAATINFEIAKPGHYKLEVYDLFGNLVLKPLDDDLNEGKYSVVIDGRQLSIGTYFYSLISVYGRETKRMVVVK